MDNVTGKRIAYEFRVTLTQPISADPDDPDYPTEDVATSREYRRGLERELIRDLKRLNWDADVELIAHEVEED